MSYDDNNIFARMLREEIPCDKVMENDYILAFHDIDPKAPVHILVIPKGQYTDIGDFSVKAGDEEITEFWRAVRKIASDQGLNDNGYRVICNTGSHGGQEVPHFHAHILGGKPVGPMVCGH